MKLSLRIHRNHIVCILTMGLFSTLFTACVGPVERSRERQEARVDTRTEHRMENRGW